MKSIISERVRKNTWYYISRHKNDISCSPW